MSARDRAKFFQTITERRNENISLLPVKHLLPVLFSILNRLSLAKYNQEVKLLIFQIHVFGVHSELGERKKDYRVASSY